MPSLKIRREDSRDDVVLRLEGTFDSKSAAALREVIDGLAGHPVVLDFTRVALFQDLAVPILARGLTHLPVRLVGLSRHPERLFRYFGVGLAPAAAAFCAEETPAHEPAPLAAAQL